MKTYHNFIGIDIGKSNFVVAEYGAKITKEYENNSTGISLFIEEFGDILANSLCIVETTGGYELALLYSLCEAKIAVHRANTRKVKNFIRSHGNEAKTDALDAKALAKYGKERVEELELFKPQTEKAIVLFQLVQRRHDLMQMLVAEKNRIQQPSAPKLIQQDIKKMVKQLSSQIERLTNGIKALIAADPILKKKERVLLTIHGIGKIVAFELLVLLPELGKISRKKIASLAGLAPRANDSGRFKGYRRTGHGRAGIRPILYLAALAARNSNSELRSFYERLVARGKKKMVAITALMRKILVIANARLKALEIDMNLEGISLNSTN